MRIVIVYILLLAGFLVIGRVPAQAAGDYRITNFSSHLVVNQDTSITVTETIEVNFDVEKHGIFRVIPVIYSAKGKTIRAGLSDIKITDGKGKSLLFERSRRAQSIELKIGDPDRTLTGQQTYIIEYKISDVILIYDGQPEIYWNITGHEWDTESENTQATLESPYGAIIQTDCYAGVVGTQQRDCVHGNELSKVSFQSLVPVGQGTDFTIVARLDQNNSLRFPGLMRRITKLIWDNIGYLLALTPAILIFGLWYSYGRDRAWQGASIYYKPTEEKSKKVSPWERQYLPLVYAPIKGLTPAQIGTILDERVDLQDVVAEILELARLGYLTIQKITVKKGWLGPKDDYLLIRQNKGDEALKDYQKYLLEKLFVEKVTSKALKQYSELNNDLKQQLTLMKNQDYAFISNLENVFYTYLDEFKEKLYENMEHGGFFSRNPQKARGKWFAVFMAVDLGIIGLIVAWGNSVGNSYPLVLASVLSVVSLPLAWFMPSRTPQGHAFYRQIKGLKYFIDKGQWRQEISEKHLFLEETLPLAISLGIVGKLTADMAVLQIPPPAYLHGFTTASIAHDLSTFQSTTANMVSTAPSSSGRSSWSGGSGFSGGGGGGGFGGGGGGSW